MDASAVGVRSASGALLLPLGPFLRELELEPTLCMLGEVARSRRVVAREILDA